MLMVLHCLLDVLMPQSATVHLNSGVSFAIDGAWSLEYLSFEHPGSPWLRRWNRISQKSRRIGESQSRHSYVIHVILGSERIIMIISRFLYLASKKSPLC